MLVPRVHQTLTSFNDDVAPLALGGCVPDASSGDSKSQGSELKTNDARPVTAGAGEVGFAIAEKAVLVFSAVACGVVGILRACLIPDRATAFDRDTLLFFVGSGAIVLLNRVKRIAFGDNAVDFMEQAKKELHEAIQEQRVLASDGIGGKAPVAGRTAELAPAGADPEDPNCGAFGGLAMRNERTLNASVERLKDAPGFYRVRLEVRSTNPEKLLTGQVRFHLHPTFRRPVVTVRPVKGAAIIYRTAFGAFTVGAEVRGPGGEPTRLELDLSKLDDAPEGFKNN